MTRRHTGRNPEVTPQFQCALAPRKLQISYRSASLQRTAVSYANTNDVSVEAGRIPKRSNIKDRDSDVCYSVRLSSLKIASKSYTLSLKSHLLQQDIKANMSQVGCVHVTIHDQEYSEPLYRITGRGERSSTLRLERCLILTDQSVIIRNPFLMGTVLSRGVDIFNLSSGYIYNHNSG
jgi:hypothetical protein